MNKKEREQNTIHYYTKGDENMIPESGNNYNMNKNSNKFHSDFIEMISWEQDSEGYYKLSRIGINKTIENFTFKKKRSNKL
jgi:hypothetical protein